jgi:hypothetical protein
MTVKPEDLAASINIPEASAVVIVDGYQNASVIEECLGEGCLGIALEFANGLRTDDVNYADASSGHAKCQQSCIGRKAMTSERVLLGESVLPTAGSGVPDKERMPDVLQGSDPTEIGRNDGR